MSCGSKPRGTGRLFLAWYQHLRRTTRERRATLDALGAGETVLASCQRISAAQATPRPVLATLVLLFLMGFMSLRASFLSDMAVVAQTDGQLILSVRYLQGASRGDAIMVGALPVDAAGNNLTTFSYAAWPVRPGYSWTDASGYAYVDIRYQDDTRSVNSTAIKFFMYIPGRGGRVFYERTFPLTKHWTWPNGLSIDANSFRTVSQTPQNLDFEVRYNFGVHLLQPVSLVPLPLKNGDRFTGSIGSAPANNLPYGYNLMARSALSWIEPAPDSTDAILLTSQVQLDPSPMPWTPLSYAVVPRVKYWSRILTDSDSDGISDANELLAGTNPHAIDTDDDGLDDGWEMEGYRDTNGRQWADSNLPFLGADPRHRDVFAEVDYLHGPGHDHRMHVASIVKAKQLYSTLAIANPDEIGGINLHIYNDDMIEFDAGIAGVCGMQTMFRDYFAPRKQRIFHWAISGHGGGGQAHVVSNDLIFGTGTGGNPDGGDMSDVEKFVGYAAFVHELGHNLGLLHEGRDGANQSNGKVNYPSLMNYAYDYSFDGSGYNLASTLIQFSLGTSPSLDENYLYELGNDPVMSYVIGYDGDFLGPNWFRTALSGSPTTLSIDWNQDGSFTAGRLSLDFASPSTNPMGDGLRSGQRDSNDAFYIRRYIGPSIRAPRSSCASGGQTGNRFIPDYVADDPVNPTNATICGLTYYKGLPNHPWLQVNPVFALRPGDFIVHPVMRDFLASALDTNFQVRVDLPVVYPPAVMSAPPLAAPEPESPLSPPLAEQGCLAIQCPGDVTAYACGSNCVPVNYSASASNSCAPTNVFVVLDPPTGTCFPLGITPVRVTAFSSDGQTNECSFTVTVLPDPNCQSTGNCLDITCPTNTTVYACNANCVPVPFKVTATDRCSSNQPIVVTDLPSDYCFPLGTTWVHATAYGSGQTNQCSFSVTVISDPNCNPPANCLDLHCPTNVTAYTCGSNCVSVPFSVWAANLCNSNPVSVVTDFPSGYCFPPGTIWVQATAYGNGQTNYCSFPVNVLPNPSCPSNNPPCLDIHCSTNLTAYACGTNCVPVYYGVWAENRCNSNDVSLVTYPRSGTPFCLGTTTVDAWAYGSGQSNHCSFTVTVLPDPSCQPTNCIDIHCPTNLTAYTCGSNCVAVPFTVWATDRCSSNQVSVVTDRPTGYCFPLGTTWVNATASGSGQSAQCSFPVTVLLDPKCPPPGGGCTNCNTGCSTNLLVNGSFENPGVPDGYVALAGGDPVIHGWVTALNGVEYYNPVVAPSFVNTGFAADGVYLLDLAAANATGAGIRQTFATVPGRSYRVSFAMGTSKERGRNGTASLTVTVAGTAHAFNVSTGNPSITWEWKEFSFVATSSAATLVFSTMDDPALSFVNLDDVRVSDCCTDPGLKLTPTVTVEWNCGILQSAPEVTGPFTDVPGATSPYTTPTAGLQRYFRTR